MPQDQKKDENILDLALDSEFEIDAGVTSGADSSEWDLEEGRVDTCPDSAKGQAADSSAPAVCKSSSSSKP
jgi:hypothetical protein